jgi:hypothetical protein
VTGWQHKPGAFGTSNARRLKQTELEEVRIMMAKKDPVKAASN